MDNNKNMTIGIVIPTRNGIAHLPHCLTPLMQSSLKPRILIIDSNSNDGTAELARFMNIEVLQIPQKNFNHGSTRELGRKYLDTDIIVMMTQDAYPKSFNLLETLLKPLVNEQASVAYARQVPHQEAGFFGSFARYYNYPAKSHIRGLKDAKFHGAYTFFSSNSCAAYLNAALDEVGGFSECLFGEDTVILTKLLYQGHQVAYVAEAEVMHSHDYSLKEEFKRNFDIGLSRASIRDLIERAETDCKRGRAYAWDLLKTVVLKKPFLLPYAVLHIWAKFLGYQAGKRSLKTPIWFKKLLSSQKFYWDNFERK